MAYRLILLIFILSLTGCCCLQRDSRTSPTAEGGKPEGVAYCAQKPGDGCVSPLYEWVAEPHAKPWAVGCNIGQNRFSSWCKNTGKTILYVPGVPAKPSDCD